MTADPRPTTARRRWVPRLLFLGLGLGAAALATSFTGGFTLEAGGVKLLRLHNPARLTIASALTLGTYLLLDWQGALRRTSGLARFLDRHAPAIAVSLALAALAIGIRVGVYVASGADSYGYISQADLWLAGALTTELPSVAARVQLPDTAQLFTPLGYTQGARAGTVVPVYAPGLPLTMAAAKALGGAHAVYYVVPVLGAAAVWMTYSLGAAAGSRPLGLAAALLLLLSPVFLFQLAWPMSDVPVAALWTAALLLAVRQTTVGSVLAGLAAGWAITVRPNLVPLAAVLGLWLAWAAPSLRDAARRFGAFCLGAAPAVLFIAILNARLHGAPWASGYGGLDTLYAWRYVPANVTHHASWMLTTQGPLLFAIVLLYLPVRLELRRDLRALIGAFAATVWLCYVAYLPYHDGWWFLRFLLPALPIAILGALAACRSVAHAVFGRDAGRFVAAAIVAATAFYQVSHDDAKLPWNLRPGEQRHITAAEVVRTIAGSRAVCISSQHSGSLRYYAGCLTARYEWLRENELESSLRALEAAGLRPYFVLDDWEQQVVAARFGLPADSRQWPFPIVGEVPRVRVFDAGARANQE